jgi:hypothetical protein
VNPAILLRFGPSPRPLLFEAMQDEEIEYLISLHKNSNDALGIGIEKQLEVRLDIQGKHHEIDY